MVKMTSWFKKHFTCIRREPTTMAASAAATALGDTVHQANKEATTESHIALTSSTTASDCESSSTSSSGASSTCETLTRKFDRTKTIIVKNDLAKSKNKMIKNSNEYRDYSRSCESNFIAAENYCNKLKKNNTKNTNNSTSVKSNASKISKTSASNNNAVVMSKLQQPQQQQQMKGPREINNNLGLETLMRQLRACNECTSQKKICRVHFAMVSKVNAASRSVTVEWYERGETKGKEVEMDMLLQLNPGICNMSDQPTIIVPTATQPTNLQRESSESSPEESLDDLIDVDDAEEDDKIVVTPQTNSNTISGGGGTMPIRTTNTATKSANATQGAIRVRNSIPNPSYNAGRPARPTNIQPIQQTPQQQTNGGSDHTENIPPSVKNRIQNSTTRTSIANPNTMAAANVGQRRSYVLKEVEKLKENREKRRAKQAELREEKVALMNMDPGNPNWELAAMIREYQSTVDFRPLVDGLPMKTQQISVCVRKRPVSRKEVMKKELDVISVPTKDTLLVHEPKTKVDLTKYLENHKFRFDYAFDDTCTNELVYKYTAKPLVQTIFEGGMATCFAYGQTGSGKTHTMGGEFSGKIQDCKGGIYAMAAKDVFALLRSPKYAHLNLVVSASFFEIYSGKVFDLLSNKQKLRVLEDGKQQVQVVGLTEKVVDSVDEVLKLIAHGNSTRTSGQTSANANSSRSHAVFQIVVRPSGSIKIHGKFSFIDLAGNERGADTSSANRQTRMEGAEINKSLLALKECIRALGRQNAHLPFRVSKLTQVLRDSFIGEKSRTCMIAMISPGLNSCEHTLNTLRYADRVKELVASDPSERIDDVEPMESDEPKNGQMTENDLAALRSLNEHDMSVELYQQQQAITELQICEEELIDQHKLMNEFLQKFIPESQSLYDKTNDIDYDQDEYCKRGEELFSQLAEFATGCKDLMVDFRAKLAQEELVSHNIKPGKR